MNSSSADVSDCMTLADRPGLVQRGQNSTLEFIFIEEKDHISGEQASGLQNSALRSVKLENVNVIDD